MQRAWFGSKVEDSIPGPLSTTPLPQDMQHGDNGMPTGADVVPVGQTQYRTAVTSSLDLCSNIQSSRTYEMLSEIVAVHVPRAIELEQDIYPVQYLSRYNH